MISLTRSLIAAEGAIANVVGMTQMNPPVKDLLPRMTPILRNRHEKVQEATINLIGRIADRGAEFVPAKEWMRICFELLDLLKAHKKSIRRAAVNSFGYIAKAIGPQDVLSVLLTNLKVQERQSRVCSTVAIGEFRLSGSDHFYVTYPPLHPALSHSYLSVSCDRLLLVWC